MSVWRQIRHGLRVLTRRTAADRELSDELDHYIEQVTNAHRLRGMPAEDARRAALLEVGNRTALQEEVRSYGWENAIATVAGDARHAGRQLRRNPSFALIGVITIALGIGATTAIFSAVHPILIEPLPYPNADRVVMIWDVGASGTQQEGTFATYKELADRNATFSAIAVMKPWRPTLTGPEQPERFEGQRVSWSYFRVLGVAPILGRSFEPVEDRQGGPQVVILSDRIWHRRFAADRAIVGRQITLDDRTYTVVGVMPPGFENVVASSAELWAPLQYDMSEGRAWGHHLRTVGRLRPGVSIETAHRDLNGIARSLVEKHPQAFGHPDLAVSLLQDEVTREVKPALVAVSGAVLLLLLIACVNVANLLIARGTQREGEFALRAALGAGRRRLVRQLLTESLLLTALGGMAGLAVAWTGVRVLVAMSPASVPRIQSISIDGAVFGFALAVTVLVGIALGVVPALRAAKADLHGTLQLANRRTAGSRQLVRRLLVVSEVAVAVVLLLTAGLLVRSVQRLFDEEPGFIPTNLLTMQVQTAGRRFSDDSATRQFVDRSLEAVRQTPGVSGAAFTSQLPLSGDADVYGVQLEREGDATADRSVYRYAVSPGYFAVMGIPLRSGRLLDEHDVGGAPLAVLVNESYARRAFPGQNPLGQRLHIGSTDGPWYSIVGVVGDVKQVSLAVDRADAVYVTSSQWFFADNAMSLVVRTGGDASSMTAAVRNAIWSVDKDQPISRVATMDRIVADSAAERRFAMMLFVAFALVALVLAAAGVYGVIAGSVAERTRELGVRAALGASRVEIGMLVARYGLGLTTAGVAIGLAGAVLATQGIASLIYGISRLDPFTYATVILVLTAVAAAACAVPAWRASRIDLAATLRAE
ncbi:MAG: hypothetical protein MNPFHGCM_02914 [Gemmatimonadaceae bacterium]|nr:hypothetical protein [Gemmatimonadaceae bacterium]